MVFLDESMAFGIQLQFNKPRNRNSTLFWNSSCLIVRPVSMDGLALKRSFDGGFNNIVRELFSRLFTKIL